MNQYNYAFYEALKDYVLHDKQGETHAFLGGVMCTARPYADLHFDPELNGERNARG